LLPATSFGLGGRVAVAHMELVNDTGDQIATGSAACIVS
jgi:hypothetical protein